MIRGRERVGTNVVDWLNSGISPKFVSSGLTFYVDSRDTNSYPGTGTIWTDIIHDNKIELYGPTYTDGVFNFITDDYGLLSGSTYINIPNGQTISIWVYSTDFDQNGFLFEKTTDGTLSSQYSLFFYSGAYGKIQYRTIGLSTETMEYNLTFGEYNNSWINIVCSYDGTYKKIYVNNVLKATSGVLTGSMVDNSTGNAIIGRASAGAWTPGVYPFNGKMSSIQLYDRALNTTEIEQNYNYFLPNA